jgi:hypothetical protein
MTSPLQFPPIDDAGADTFERYRYQARVLAPLAIACGRSLVVYNGGSILAIVCEHHEDALVETSAGWRAIQIKTRNQSLGPWRIRDVTGPQGGLCHLALTAQRLGESVIACELWLEGTVGARDDLEQLRRPAAERSGMDRLSAALARDCDIEPSRAATFLAKTSVRVCPARHAIDSMNRDFLGGQFPLASRRTIDYVLNEILSRISGAQEARREGADLLCAFIEGRIDEPTAFRLHEKQVRRDHLEQILGILSRPMLSANRTRAARSLVPIDPGSVPESVRTIPLDSPQLPDQVQTESLISDLERKLTEAGATVELIASAQSVRAVATQRESEWLAASRADPLRDAALDDLRERLLVIATPIAAQHRGESGRAGRVFREIRLDLEASLQSLDLPGLVANDVNVLLGMVCGLSDECKVDWGGPNPEDPPSPSGTNRRPLSSESGERGA